MKTKILAALLAGVLPISFSMSAPAMAVEKNSEKTTTAAATVVKTNQKTDTDKDKKITTVEPGQTKEIELAPGEGLQFKEGSKAKIILETNKDLSGDGIKLTNNPAPNCVSAQNEWGFVQVYNNCDVPTRVKVIMAFAGDTKCMVVQPGTRANIGPAIGRVDGIVLC